MGVIHVIDGILHDLVDGTVIAGGMLASLETCY